MPNDFSSLIHLIQSAWHWVVGGSTVLLIISVQFKRVRTILGNILHPIIYLVKFPSKLINTIETLSEAVNALRISMTEVHEMAIVANAKASMAFEDDPTPRFECDVISGDCIWTNQSCQGLFGLGSDQMLGKGWLQAIHPDDINTTASRWEETIKHWSPYRARYRILRQGSNTPVLVEATAKVITNQTGKPLTIWGKINPVKV